MTVNFIKKNIYTSLFVCILVIASFLRLYSLDNTPSGFHRDEVANAYLGRFVIENGKDIYGNSWPLFTIDKKGDYPPVVPMYIAGLSTKVFGETIWATRMPFAIFGIITVIITYFCARLIFPAKKPYALFAMLASATMPWQVSFSRIGAEGVMAGMFFMSGLFFILWFLRMQKTQYMLASILMFSVTYLLYPSYRVTVPFIFLSFILVAWIAKLGLSRNSYKYLTAATLFFFVLTFVISQTAWGSGRFNQTSWLGAYASGEDPMRQYSMQDKNITRARIFSNKIIYFSQSFIREYIQYFSPQFLLTDQARPVWFAVPRMGLLQLSIFVLFVATICASSFVMSNKLHKLWYLLIFSLILIAPLGSALTSEHTPNSHRAYEMSLLIPVFITFIFVAFENIKAKLGRFITVLFVCLMIIETIWLSYNMFVQWNIHSAVYRDDGLLQVAKHASENKDNYKKVYIFNSGWFPIYYLFASKNFNTNLIGKFPGEFQIESIGEIEFLRMECPQDTWQISYKEKGNVALYVQKDCKLDKMSTKPKFVKNIQGLDPRFESMALHVVYNK